jgi:ankyrin repeat protein
MDQKRLSEALHRIFRRNNLHLPDVRDLLKEGVHPDKIVRPDDKWPLLACMSYSPPTDYSTYAQDFVQVFIELVKHGANVNKTVRGGDTPLSLLCRSLSYASHLMAEPMLQCLLEAGADPLACKDSPITALIGFGPLKGEVFAQPFKSDVPEDERHAFWRSLQRLLDAGVDINAFERRGLYNPLLMAAIVGADQALQRLLELGADPHMVNKDGNTALMYAAGDADGLSSIVAGISCTWMREGDTQAVTRLLLAQGVNPTASNNRKRTALGIALRNECFDVAFELAQALSSNGLLTKSDLKGFNGSAFEEKTKTLAVVAAQKKTAGPKDLTGSAQMASWDATAKELEYSDSAKHYNHFLQLIQLFKLIRDALDPIYQRRLYATSGVFGFYLSVTKNFISRRGWISISFSAVEPKLHLKYEAEGKDNEWVRNLAERIVLLNESGLPEQDELLTNLVEMIREHLNVELGG